MPDVAVPLVPRGRIVGLAFGAMQSTRRGAGSDVAGARPYVPGDNVAAIHWAASARLSSARGSDEFVVRERYAEEAPRVVVVADRRPEMRLFPPGLPWLQKPRALAVALELVVGSAVHAHGFVGYLDFAEGGREPLWIPPHGKSLWEVEEREGEDPPFDAPADNVERALEFLSAHPRSVPPGSFVFVVSDFLVPPPVDTWLHALEHRWDVIPVVLQDPVWERTFPAVETFDVAVADVDGAVRRVRLTRTEARALRAEHEARWERLQATFAAADITPVVVDSHEPGHVVSAFLDWAERRRLERW